MFEKITMRIASIELDEQNVGKLAIALFTWVRSRLKRSCA